MRYQYVKPSAFLSDFVKHYWVLEIDEEDGRVAERVIPTGNIELMFHYRKPFAVINAANNSLSSQPLSVLSGLISGFSDVTSVGDSGVLAVSFHPFGACQFFRFPLDEIENKSIDLRAVLGDKIRDIEEQLSNAYHLTERIVIVEDFLKKSFCPLNTYDLAFLKRAVSLIETSKAGIQAHELAGLLAVSNKGLERKFAARLGKTPKQYLKMMRFQMAVKRLSMANDQALTDLAYQCGYFDQAHFIRDFKLFSGYTPGEFRQMCNFQGQEGVIE